MGPICGSCQCLSHRLDTNMQSIEAVAWRISLPFLGLLAWAVFLLPPASHPSLPYSPPGNALVFQQFVRHSLWLFTLFYLKLVKVFI